MTQITISTPSGVYTYTEDQLALMQRLDWYAAERLRAIQLDKPHSIVAAIDAAMNERLRSLAMAA